MTQVFVGNQTPLTVQNSRLTRDVVDKWVDAAVNTGYKRNPDYNGADQEGVGYFQLTKGLYMFVGQGLFVDCAKLSKSGNNHRCPNRKSDHQ